VYLDVSDLRALHAEFRRFGVEISGDALQLWRKSMHMHVRALGLAMMLHYWLSGTRYLFLRLRGTVLSYFLIDFERQTVFRFISTTGSDRRECLDNKQEACKSIGVLCGVNVHKCEELQCDK